MKYKNYTIWKFGMFAFLKLSPGEQKNKKQMSQKQNKNMADFDCFTSLFWTLDFDCFIFYATYNSLALYVECFYISLKLTKISEETNPIKSLL